jgi:hypothetical protein
MNFDDLSPSEQQAVHRAMVYWTENWDWECPTLLGIQLDDLMTVLASWPKVPAGSADTTGLAALGAVRELLGGGSAIPADQVPMVTGLSYSEAGALCSKILGKFDGVG